MSRALYRIGAISPVLKIKNETTHGLELASRRWRKAAGGDVAATCDLGTVAHERLDVLPIGQLRKPGVRLVALHVDQPSFRHSNISIGMIEFVEFPNFVEQHAVRVRLLDLPPGLLRARQFLDGLLVPVHLEGSGIKRGGRRASFRPHLSAQS